MDKGMDKSIHRHRNHLHLHLHGRPEEDAHPPPPPLFAGNPPHDHHMGPSPGPPPLFPGNPPHDHHMGPGPPPLFAGNPPHDYHMVPGPELYPPPPPPKVSVYPPPAVDPHPHTMPCYPPQIAHQVFDELSKRPTVRMFCKADSNYSLAIRDGHVILARSNPSDLSQHWIKDEKLSTMVKDEDGLPSFALINKATGHAMKHSFGATHPVKLIRYEIDGSDESVLWSQSKDLGDGYRAIRMVNNIRLNVNAYNGDKKRDGVHDGTQIVLGEWKRGDNQRWRIVPYTETRSAVAGKS